MKPKIQMKSKRTLDDMLREDAAAVRAERFELFLKILCGIAIVGYLIWITIDLISS